LLVELLRRVGLTAIADGIRQVGWGFAAILAVSAVRIGARAAAWRLCFARGERPRFPEAFAAGLCAEAAGSLTPLGVLASEPMRAAAVRRRVAFARAFTAVVVENFFYSLSVALVIAAGMIALLFAFELPARMRLASELSLGVMIAVAALMVAIVALAGHRLPRTADPEPPAEPGRWPGLVRRRLRELDRRARTALEATRGRVGSVLGAEAVFHAGGVAEAYVTLWLLAGAPPSLLAAFILESVNRAINVVFRFVPLRVGVDEAGTAAFAQAIGLDVPTGVTLALVRKARVLVWSAAGVVLLLRQGLGTRRLLDDPEVRAALARSEP
jgi:hypothetical protein